MTPAEAHEAVTQRFKDLMDDTTWALRVPNSGTAQSVMAYGLPNYTFDAPEDGRSSVTLDINEAVSEQYSMASAGQALHEHELLLLFKIRTPLGLGAGNYLAILGALRGSFQSTRFSGVTCYGVLSTRGAREDSRWSTVVLECPASYYETK